MLVVGDDGCFRFPPKNLSSAYLGLFVGDDGCFRFRYHAAQSVVFRDDGCFRFPPKNQEEYRAIAGFGCWRWSGRTRTVARAWLVNLGWRVTIGCGCVFRLVYLLLSKENRRDIVGDDTVRSSPTEVCFGFSLGR